MRYTEDAYFCVTILCEIVGSDVSNVPVLLGKDLVGQINVVIKKGLVKFEMPAEANNIFTIAAKVLEEKIPSDVQKLSIIISRIQIFRPKYRRASY